MSSLNGFLSSVVQQLSSPLELESAVYDFKSLITILYFQIIEIFLDTSSLSEGALVLITLDSLHSPTILNEIPMAVAVEV